MGIKRLMKKVILDGAGSFVNGHLIDAYQKKKQTGASYTDCLKDSIKETITEDLPGSSHLYDIGKRDGKKAGTVEQAKRDEEKIQELHKRHEKDRRTWEECDKIKEELLDECERQLKNK